MDRAVRFSSLFLLSEHDDTCPIALDYHHTVLIRHIHDAYLVSSSNAYVGKCLDSLKELYRIFNDPPTHPTLSRMKEIVCFLNRTYFVEDPFPLPRELRVIVGEGERLEKDESYEPFRHSCRRGKTLVALVDQIPQTVYYAHRLIVESLLLLKVIQYHMSEIIRQAILETQKYENRYRHNVALFRREVLGERERKKEGGGGGGGAGRAGVGKNDQKEERFFEDSLLFVHLNALSDCHAKLGENLENQAKHMKLSRKSMNIKLFARHIAVFENVYRLLLSLMRGRSVSVILDALNGFKHVDMNLFVYNEVVLLNHEEEDDEEEDRPDKKAPRFVVDTMPTFSFKTKHALWSNVKSVISFLTDYCTRLYSEENIESEIAKVDDDDARRLRAMIQQNCYMPTWSKKTKKKKPPKQKSTMQSPPDLCFEIIPLFSNTLKTVQHVNKELCTIPSLQLSPLFTTSASNNCKHNNNENRDGMDDILRHAKNIVLEMNNRHDAGRIELYYVFCIKDEPLLHIRCEGADCCPVADKLYCLDILDGDNHNHKTILECMKIKNMKVMEKRI